MRNRFGIRVSAVLLAGAVLSVLLAAPAAFAGTQDFTLVNNTGVDVYSLYISETSNDNWEEDVLGEDVLPDGNRVDITFTGHDACLWDMMVTDGDDGQLIFQGVNLCQASVVVLRCDDEECWAETE